MSLGECELCGTVYVFMCVSCVCVCSCKWPKGEQRDGEMEAQKEKKPTEPRASENTDTERVRE